MDEKLTKRDRRFSWEAIVLLITTVVNMGGTLLSRLLISWSNVETKLLLDSAWGDADKTPFLKKLLLFIGDLVMPDTLVNVCSSFLFYVALLLLCVAVLCKARRALLSAALGVGSLLLAARVFLNTVQFPLSFLLRWFDFYTDGKVSLFESLFSKNMLGFFWNYFLSNLYIALPLVLGFLFLALVSACDIGKNGKNPLSRIKGLLSGFALAFLGIHFVTAVFSNLSTVMETLGFEIGSSLGDGAFGEILVSLLPLLFFIPLRLLLFVEAFALLATALWIVQPYRRAARVRALTLENERTGRLMRFPVGAVLLFVSALLPFFFSIREAEFSIGGGSLGIEARYPNVFDLSLNSFFGNLAFLATLVLVVVLLLKKRGVLLTAALGVKLAAVLTIPPVAWLLHCFFSYILYAQSIRWIDLVRSLFSHIGGVSFAFFILFLLLIAAGALGKKGKNALARGKWVFFGFSMASLALFALVELASPLWHFIGARLDVCKLFFGTLEYAVKRDALGIGELLECADLYLSEAQDYPGERLAALLVALVSTAKPLFVALFKVFSWIVVAVWVVHPDKKLPKPSAQAVKITATTAEDVAVSVTPDALVNIAPAEALEESALVEETSPAEDFSLAEDPTPAEEPIPTEGPAPIEDGVALARYFCTHCGKRITVEADAERMFCPYCGARVFLR